MTRRGASTAPRTSATHRGALGSCAYRAQRPRARAAVTACVRVGCGAIDDGRRVCISCAAHYTARMPLSPRRARNTAQLTKLLVGAALTVSVACGADEPGTLEGTFHLESTAVMDRGVSFSNALYQTVGVTMQPGHRAELIENGAVFDALAREISAARSSVHLLLYIWKPGAASDRVIAALAGRAKGVECRVLVDAFGSLDFDDTLQGPLNNAGCEVRIFRPLPGAEFVARNHRKIAVFDGKVAITGGFGIRDEWLGDGHSDGSWRDTNALVHGPTVASAQQAFAENWQEAGGALLPPHAFPELKPAGPVAAAFVASTASPVVTRAERLTQLMIASAKKRVWIANAYFVPSESLLTLIQEKASQGVDVRLLVPGFASDSKAAFGSQQLDYGDLTGRGARVWEYQPSMMHAKTMIVDDKLVTVGSINLDPLSLNELEEAALVLEDAELNKQLAASFEKDCELAQEVGKD